MMKLDTNLAALLTPICYESYCHAAKRSSSLFSNPAALLLSFHTLHSQAKQYTVLFVFVLLL